MRSVIAGVDGSERSFRALHFASDLVEELEDAELVVCYARHVPAFWLPENVAEAEYHDVLDRVEAGIREAAEKQLADRCVKWRFEVRDDEPSKVLSEVAKEAGDGAVVVVGRGGSSAVHEFLVGSVANRLVHRGTCALLLVD